MDLGGVGGGALCGRKGSWKRGELSSAHERLRRVGVRAGVWGWVSGRWAGAARGDEYDGVVCLWWGAVGEKKERGGKRGG